MILKPVTKPDPNKLSEAYELAEDLNGPVKVPAGFQYDGASIPAFAWQIIGTPFRPKFMRASIFHDWTYHTHQIERPKIDNILRTLLGEDGVEGWRLKAMYEAVSRFGGAYWKNDAEDEAYIKRLTARILADGKIPKDYGL